MMRKAIGNPTQKSPKTQALTLQSTLRLAIVATFKFPLPTVPWTIKFAPLIVNAPKAIKPYVMPPCIVVLLAAILAWEPNAP